MYLKTSSGMTRTVWPFGSLVITSLIKKCIIDCLKLVKNVNQCSANMKTVLLVVEMQKRNDRCKECVYQPVFLNLLLFTLSVGLEMTSSDLLFCPQHKGVHFTVIEEERNQKIFTVKKLQRRKFSLFFQSVKLSEDLTVDLIAES